MTISIARVFALVSLFTLSQVNVLSAAAVPVAANEPLQNVSSFFSGEQAAVVHMVSSLPPKVVKKNVIRPLRKKADDLYDVLKQDDELAQRVQTVAEDLQLKAASCACSGSVAKEISVFIAKAVVTVTIDVLARAAISGDISLNRQEVVKNLASVAISTLQSKK